MDTATLLSISTAPAAQFNQPSFTILGPQSYSRLIDSRACLLGFDNGADVIYRPFVRSIVAPPRAGENYDNYSIVDRQQWCHQVGPARLQPKDPNHLAERWRSPHAQPPSAARCRPRADRGEQALADGRADIMLDADSSIASYLYSNSHANCATLAEAKWLQILQGSLVFLFRESDAAKARQLSEAIVRIMQTPAYTSLQHDQLYVGDACGSEFSQISDTMPVSLHCMSGLFVIAGLLAILALAIAVVQRHCHRSGSGTEAPLVERIDDVPAYLELTSLASRPSLVTSMRPSVAAAAAHPGRRSLPTSPEVETLRASLAQVHAKVDALTEVVARQSSASLSSPGGARRHQDDAPTAAEV